MTEICKVRVNVEVNALAWHLASKLSQGSSVLERGLEKQKHPLLSAFSGQWG